MRDPLMTSRAGHAAFAQNLTTWPPATLQDKLQEEMALRQAAEKAKQAAEAQAVRPGVGGVVHWRDCSRSQRAAGVPGRALALAGF